MTLLKKLQKLAREEMLGAILRDETVTPQQAIDKIIANTVTAVLDEIEREVGRRMEHYAHLEHERWSNWQRYCHKIFKEGKFEEFLPRWERQINTSFKDLSEPEKESDREQVRPYIDDIKAIITNKRTEI